MIATPPREVCCVIQCEKSAEYVLGVLRAPGEVTIGFCSQHTVEVMPSLIDGPYVDARPGDADIARLEADLEKQGVSADVIGRFQQLLWSVATDDVSESDGEFIVRVLQAAVPRGLRVIAVAISGEEEWTFQGIGGGSKPGQAPE